MAYARRLALPDETVIGGADPASGPGADGLDGLGADPQQETSDTAGNGRARHLVQHDAAALAHMLDGEEAAIGKHADGEAGLIGYLPQAQIAVAREGESANGVLCHAKSPKSQPTPARRNAERSVLSITGPSGES